MDVTETELLPEYAEWLDRLTATFDAVSYTCRVRIGDARVAEAVALRVATGLVARPAVFRHWGLPYSGRIAKLAEDGIALADAGLPVCSGSWPDFRRALQALAPGLQADMVATCVEGHGDEALAELWACEPADVAVRRAALLAHLRELAVAHGAVATEKPATGKQGITHSEVERTP
jgi:hypothetical protein